MADCSFEIFCESDQKIEKLKSYKQLREKSKSVLSSEDFKEQHINCEECKSYKSSSTITCQRAFSSTVLYICCISKTPEALKMCHD